MTMILVKVFRKKLKVLINKIETAITFLWNPTHYHSRIKYLKKKGMKIGYNVSILHGTVIDNSRPFLIEIGNNVTLAPKCHILTHDASMYNFLNMTRIGKVKILDNCFIGANTVIMPNVTIGPNAIVGAGSVVTKNVEPFSVFAGNPAKKIDSLEHFLEKHKKNVSMKGKYPYERFHGNFITRKDALLMSNELDTDFGYSTRKK